MTYYEVFGFNDMGKMMTEKLMTKKLMAGKFWEWDNVIF